MCTTKRSHLAVHAALAAFLLTWQPLHAQTPGARSSYESADSSGDTGQATGAKLSNDDLKMMHDMAHANLAEIETGKMALEKSQSDQVRKFAEKMVDDHTTALKELQSLAQSKGVTLPKETDVQHKAIATALKVLPGDTFDKQYIARVGVGDHERTLDMLQKAQKEAKDPDLKAYAQKTQKTVSQHLNTARQMEGRK
ncbi:hypothetical protein GCM10027343_02450 [Noviherbaspirillum agri]